MGKYMELDIINRIHAPIQQQAYPETFAQVMAEIHSEFYEITHNIGVNSRVLPLDGHDPHIILPPYKFLGKSVYFEDYLKHREELKLKLFTPYPFMRKILKMCITELPDILVDFSKYREIAYDKNKLSDILSDEIAKGSVFINNFYERVLKLSNKDSTKLPKGGKVHYWRTGTGILASQFTRLLKDTIAHLVKVTGNEEQIPYLRLQLTSDKGLKLFPTDREACNMYWELVDKISEAANDLPTLESKMCSKQPEKNIPIFVLIEDIKWARERIKRNIIKMYKGINEYLSMLKENYQTIYQDEEDEEQREMNFEEGKAKIEYYRIYIDKILSMVANEYYPIGVLDQDEAKMSLKASVEGLISEVAVKLVLQHEWENRDICETFEMLAIRALQVPKTTDELMEMGVYMTWANTELMQSLRERITRSLEILARLIEMTTISAEHFDLNSETVNWLNKIKPILEQNSSMFEQTKFEFEERLQRAIERLNKGIADFFPYLEILDEMDDADNVRDYIHHLGHLLVQIRDFDQKQAWINKEETSFKFPLSTFNELEELKKYIYPFYRLVKVCLNWKRSYNAWMDGPFEFLDYPTAENQVDEYFKELLKTQKTYRIRLRQLAAEQNPRRFKGSVDDPDILNQPAPVKLTQKVLQEIKEFRPHLTLMGIMCNAALLQRHWDEMSEVAGELFNFFI